MCGRFAQIEPLSSLIKTFLVDEAYTQLGPSYNIAPGNRVLSVVVKEGRRLLVDFQWGLVPHWAQDPSIGRRLINARAESVAGKPSFKSAFTSRRCLIISSGFYEWRNEGTRKVPFFIRLESGKSFSFAGLYESWTSPDGIELRTCTIITTEPNAIMKPIHNRMPVILPRDREARWLDFSADQDKAMGVLEPYPNDDMIAYPVSPQVNSPKNDSPECIVPVLSR